MSLEEYDDVLETLAEIIYSRAYGDIKHNLCSDDDIDSRVYGICSELVSMACERLDDK